MGAPMTQRKVVMTVSKLTRRFPKDTVPFDTRSVEGNEVVADEQYFMTRFDWEDMGQPDMITITIEPGDTLNG